MLGVGLVHAEDAFILHRLVDVGEGDAPGMTAELEAAGAAGDGRDEGSALKVSHEPADHHRIGIDACGDDGRTDGTAIRLAGDDAQRVNRDHESTARQHYATPSITYLRRARFTSNAMLTVSRHFRRHGEAQIRPHRYVRLHGLARLFQLAWLLWSAQLRSP